MRAWTDRTEAGLTPDPPTVPAVRRASEHLLSPWPHACHHGAVGFLDLFRTPQQPPEPEREPAAPEPWDGSGVDWSAAGVPDDRIELAVEIASSPDFGVDPSDEPDRRWRLALFDDVRGVVGDDAIEALPTWLEQQPGIDVVEHVDRELMEVGGTIDSDALARLVVARLASTGDPGYWDEAGDESS